MGTDFSPEEWVALFPGPLPPLSCFTAIEARSGRTDEDPAAPARESRPLTREALRRDLSGSPLLAGATFAAYRLSLSPLAMLRAVVVQFCFMTALLGLAVAWSDGVFGTVQLVIGLLFRVLWLAVVVILCWAVHSSAKGWTSNTVDFEPWSGLARWLELQGLAPEEAGKEHLGPKPIGLLDHDPADRLCPCSAASCAGNAPLKAGVFAWLDYSFWILFHIPAELLICYTTFVTFGPRLFSTWWGCLLLSGFLCSALFYCLLVGLARFAVFGNLGYYGLEKRLQHRAMRIALHQALNADSIPVSDQPLVEESAPLATVESAGPPSHLYVRLYYQLMRLWNHRGAQEASFLSQMVILMLIPALLVFVILSVATGRCIPAWLLFQLAVYGNYVMINIVNLAARNAAISSIAALFRDALREIRVNAREAPWLREHEATLVSFLEVSGFEGRVFGFAVTFGSARALFVTVVTLCVALWSVLRGLGIFITLESFCPYVG
ncbi:hypothetical protein DFJ74DRAFT_650403 [Hyaloraphidium curvatum]|nr:hypothetical protein DFJ74DRAFT_650403 [Hyaloraphidium curvatum]